MIRYIALDLDGTLTNSEKKITPRTWQAVLQAQERGVCVILCSGRPLEGQRFVAEELQMHRYGGYIIAYNGGAIINYATNEVVDHVTLPLALLREVVDGALHSGFDILTYQYGQVLTNNAQSPYAQYSARNNRMTLSEVPDLVDALSPDVLKFIILGEPDKLSEYERVMQERYAGVLNITRSEPFFLEVMPEGIDKGLRLAFLMQYLGAERQQLMACGDGFNDVSMIRYAGVGVAMGNAQQAVKDVADFVTLTNDEDGVAHAIERFILQTSC